MQAAFLFYGKKEDNMALNEVVITKAIVDRFFKKLIYEEGDLKNLYQEEKNECMQFIEEIRERLDTKMQTLDELFVGVPMPHP